MATRRFAKVDVTISDTSATGGFKPLASRDAETGGCQRFPAVRHRALDQAVVKSNGGDAEYSEIMGFHALANR